MLHRFLPILAVIALPASTEVGSCPISADFVAEPETIESTQQMGQFEVRSTTRRAIVDGGMVQIECTGISPDKVFPNTDDATILANYARFWSISPTGPVYAKEEPVRHRAIQGVKEIQGVEVTYTYRLFRFDDSFAMVVTGVPGGRITKDVARFSDSIQVSLIEPYTEVELREGRRNHIAACLPAVRADNVTRNLGLSEVEITYFCSCTGQRYFSDFTRAELRVLALGEDAELQKRQNEIRVKCFEEATK